MTFDSNEAALAYLARGWCVIPIRPSEKRPLIPWLEFQQRRPSVAEVDAWFQRWPKANVGVVTGAISGIVVVDVDVGHGGDESLAQLTRFYGSLSQTIEAITGGGGRHVYFQHPGGVVGNRTGIAPGIDVRGDGGYVLAPPSLHPSGIRYTWVSGSEPESGALAPLPDWLLKLTRAEGTRLGHPVEHWRQLVRQGISEGERNTAVTSLAGHLLWHGVDPNVVLDLLLTWNRERCRPPLSDDEIMRTVESVVRLHLRGEDGR